MFREILTLTPQTFRAPSSTVPHAASFSEAMKTTFFCRRGGGGVSFIMKPLLPVEKCACDGGSGCARGP